MTGPVDLQAYARRWASSPLTALTGLLAVVYGVGFAVIDRLPVGLTTWTWVGAVLMVMAFVASIVHAAAAQGRS